jgi:hypothetical protein
MTNLFDRTIIEGVSFLENLDQTELNKIRAIANKKIHNAGSLAADLLKDDNTHLYPKDLPIDKRFDYLLGANSSYVQSNMVLKLLRFNELLSSIGEYFPLTNLVSIKHYFTKFNPSKKMVLETKTQVSFCFDEYDKFSLLDSESWISELEKYRNKVRQGIKQLLESENQAGYDAQHGNDNSFLFYTMNAIYKTFPADEKALSSVDKTNTLPDQPTKPTAEISKYTLKEQITHKDRLTIADEIITKYKGIKGYKLRILYEALIVLDLFHGGRTASLFYECCENDFGDVGSYQAMEKKKFERGQELKNGDYVKSAHDEIFDNVILFLKSIIKTK